MKTTLLQTPKPISLPNALRGSVFSQLNNNLCFMADPAGGDDGAGGGDSLGDDTGKSLADGDGDGDGAKTAADKMYNSDDKKTGDDDDGDDDEDDDGKKKPDDKSSEDDKKKSDDGDGDDKKSDKKGDKKSDDGDDKDKLTTESYDFTIPAEVGLKDDKGEPFQFEENDPYVQEVREAMLEEGAPATLAPKLSAIYARSIQDTVKHIENQRLAAISSKRQEELASLRVEEAGKVITGEQRVERLIIDADKVLGSGASQKLVGGITDSESFKQIEKLIQIAKGGQIAGGGDVSPKQKSAAERMYGKKR